MDIKELKDMIELLQSRINILEQDVNYLSSSDRHNHTLYGNNINTSFIDINDDNNSVAQMKLANLEKDRWLNSLGMASCTFGISGADSQLTPP